MTIWVVKIISASRPAESLSRKKEEKNTRDFEVDRSSGLQATPAMYLASCGRVRAERVRGPSKGEGLGCVISGNSWWVRVWAKLATICRISQLTARLGWAIHDIQGLGTAPEPGQNSAHSKRFSISSFDTPSLGLNPWPFRPRCHNCSRSFLWACIQACDRAATG